jgi:hypothetical protein
VVAQNAGLTVADLETLRRQMKQAGGSVKVAKNRLAKLALKETDNADISALFEGPTVVAFATDPMVAPKVAAAFADKNQKFVVLGGAMGKTGLDAEQRQGARHDALAGPAARHARRHAQAARDAYRGCPAGSGRRLHGSFRPCRKRAKRPKAHDYQRAQMGSPRFELQIFQTESELKWLISPNS